MSNALVVIPTYNEIENIVRLLHNVFSLQREFDVLVVDDNSPDGTAKAVKKLKASFPDRLFIEERQGKMGLGTAYIHGFKWALERDYEYIFEMDADFSHNPNDLIRLYNACAKDGYHMAIGSRYVKGVNVVNWPMSRVLLCYHNSVLRKINLDKIQFVGYAFQIEMKFKTYLAQFKIVEVPVIFTDRTRGESKMSGGIISEAIFGVLKMKFKSLFGTNNYNEI